MSILDRCTYRNWRIPESSRALLHKMLHDPDPETWRQARRVVVCRCPLLTLEMALWTIARHPGSAVPDPFTVYRALKHTAELKDRGYEWQEERDEPGNAGA